MLNLQRRAWKILSQTVRWKITMVFFSTVLISILEVFGISLILPILGLLVEPQLLKDQPTLAKIYEFSGMESPAAFIRLLLYIMACVIVVKNISAIALNRWQISFLQGAAAGVSKEMFETYLRMPVAQTADRDIGFFSYSINSLGGIFYGTIIQQSIIIFGELLTVGLLAVALTIANPSATFVAVGTLGLSGLIIYWRTAKRLREIGVVQRKATERSLRLIKESFSAFKEIRVSGRGRFFENKYAENLNDLTKSLIEQVRTVMLTRHLIEISVAITIAVVAGLMLETATAGAAIGQLSLFGVATLRIMPSISRVVSALQTLKTTEAPMDLFESELSEMSGWQQESSYDMPPPNDNDCERVDISLQGIVFGYDVEGENVLKGVNLDIPFGSVLGIAGPSGAGKTTLADLILGVVLPSQGRSLFNGKSFYEDPGQWRQKLAYVAQKVSFLSGSLRENVAFGIMPEDIDDDRVLRCLKQAQLMDKFDELPDGLNSFLGEDGQFLSGGEKQRLGVARALYQNASVLILDEATSALDAETESKLSEVIRNLSGSRTVIIIAHRLATLKNCDQVAFMEDGSLQHASSFNNLYQTNQRFKTMVDLSRIDPAQHLD